jgi:putative addiction module killer protein
MTDNVYRVKNTKEFDEWFWDLKDDRVSASITNRINRIKAGNFGDHKSVGGFVYELRIHISPGYRVYYAKNENVIVLLLYGGTKKTQVSDIKEAQEMAENINWSDYED